ncbi:hypothetical protein GCM10011488_45270 [Steroidobacter agaridevorans]|nr:hypothetical protein GCM10011488_45270 [Steroidobacter agaridevorans]
MNDLEPRLSGTLIQALPGRSAAAKEQHGEHGIKGNPDVHEMRLRPASQRKSTTGGTVRPAIGVRACTYGPLQSSESDG